MKKNKKVKENFDNVVINRTELTPTTIGKMDSNEGGLKGVIIMFVSLLIIIFVLPYVVNYINDYNEKKKPQPVIVPETPSESESEEPEPENPQEEKEPEFISVSSPISKTINGYKYEINVNNQSKKIAVNVTNVSGSIYLLINNPMFIELYNSEKTLLDRILITKREIATNSTVAFNFTYHNIVEDLPTYLVIEEKNINDYPAVALNSKNVNEEPFLTCVKDNETLIYNFEENEKGYLLKSIINRISINENNEDLINNYEAMITNYNSIDGVEAELTNKATGFDFEATINLDLVNINDKKRILNNTAFYEKDTLAKTIAFELNSSGYNCK